MMLKNNIETILTSADAIISEAYGIALQGNDIYVEGYVNKQTGNTAVYWKNGVQKTLAKGLNTQRFTANAIIIMAK